MVVLAALVVSLATISIANANVAIVNGDSESSGQTGWKTSITPDGTLDDWSNTNRFFPSRVSIA